MEPWQILIAFAVGLVGIAKLASNNAVATNPGLTEQNALLNQVFIAAMNQETNINYLQTFQTKLNAAGYTSYANSIGSKIVRLQRGSAALAHTDIQMVPQVQSNSTGTYQATNVVKSS